MKSWVIVLLVVLALLLLLLGLREGFEATELIKDPATWDEAEYSRIRAMVTPISTANDNDIKEIVGGFFAKWKEEDYRITMDEVTSYISSKGVMPDRRTEFTQMVKAYYIDQGQSVFQQAAGYVSGFLGENTAGQFSTPTCPTDYTLATDGTGKCKYKDNTRTPIEPTCPSGSTLTFDNPPRCRNPNAPPPTEETTGAAAPGAGAAPGGAAPGGAAPGAADGTAGVGVSSGASAGNTSGGSSTSSFGPNSGSGTGGPVWGPAFTSFGSLLGGSTGDSTQSTQYPMLLGGLGNASTRLEGAGITQPSSSWQLSMSGQLPSSGSLGSDANSQFLPYSRTPGDQDIIPDPFRVSQQFSAASYSSRPEPTPFLTDFSAFLA